MKRFTETTKWQDSWFRKLPPTMKVFWNYLLDNCDVAGVWNPDMELAEFQIGASIDMEEVREFFKDRIEFLGNGRWFLTKFIAFQYGELNPSNRCHQAVLRSLAANKIEGGSKGLQRPSEGGQDKYKDKDIKGGSAEGGKITQFPVSPFGMTEGLKTHAPFLAAWADWKRHLDEKAWDMTRMQEQSVLMECAKAGPFRAAEVLRFSITKGAKNPIWDAPKGKRPATARPDEPDPDGWKRWLEEEYPEKEGLPYANAPASVQTAFRQHMKGK